MLELPRTPGIWHFQDEAGCTLPWYTKSFLDELQTWDIQNWRIFEYGAGHSTLWWEQHVHQVITVDDQAAWIEALRPRVLPSTLLLLETSPEAYVDSVLSYQPFDCIIIDGAWRNDCHRNLLAALRRPGIVVLDNSQRVPPHPEAAPLVEETLTGYPKAIFKQPDHPEWTTTYWRIA